MNSLIFNDASLPFLSNEDCLNNIDTFFEIIFYINEKNVNFNKVLAIVIIIICCMLSDATLYVVFVFYSITYYYLIKHHARGPLYNASLDDQDHLPNPD